VQRHVMGPVAAKQLLQSFAARTGMTVTNGVSSREGDHISGGSRRKYLGGLAPHHLRGNNG